MTGKEARQLALKRAEIIRSLARQGIKPTRSNIARALGVKNGYLDAVYQSFAGHDIEGVPTYIKVQKIAKKQKSRRIPGTNPAVYRVR